MGGGVAPETSGSLPGSAHHLPVISNVSILSLRVGGLPRTSLDYREAAHARHTQTMGGFLGESEEDRTTLCGFHFKHKPGTKQETRPHSL